MQSEQAARSSIIFHSAQTKPNFLRITELLKSPLLKTRMRAVIELISIPLDPNNSQADKENRTKVLNDYQNNLQTSAAKVHPFKSLVNKLKKTNILISAVRNSTQSVDILELFSVENNVSIRESIAKESLDSDSLTEHQLLASAYLYFGDTMQYSAELLKILESQNSSVCFDNCKLIHLIILKRNNLLKDNRELLQIIGDEMKVITEFFGFLKSGAEIDYSAKTRIINKLQLFACLDEFKVLIRTHWIPQLLAILNTLPDDKKCIEQKIVAFHCIEPLLHNLSHEEMSKNVLPYWLNLLFLTQASYMDEIESYDPKGIRFFYALKLFLFEVLPRLMPQDIAIIIREYFTRFDQEVEPGDLKHHLGLICLTLLPYCDVARMTQRQLNMLIEIYWELFHVSTQHEGMGLTSVKEAFVNRLFGFLVYTNKMNLLLPYFLRITQEDTCFYGESARTWLNMALDYFSPNLISALFHQDNIVQIIAMLIAVDEESIEPPAHKLNLLHKIIYMCPPELLANNQFDQIWAFVYQEMQEVTESEEQIKFLIFLLILGMRLPAEKIITYFNLSQNIITSFIFECFDLATNCPKYMNLMMVVIDILIQRLSSNNYSVMRSLCEKFYLEMTSSASAALQHLNRYLWIAARIFPMFPIEARAIEAVKWYSIINQEISIYDADVPRVFLKRFAILSGHLSQNIYRQYLPLLTISIGQLINARTYLEDLFEILDDLILLYSIPQLSEFSSLFYSLIMKSLIAIIGFNDPKDENNAMLRINAMNYFLEMLNSCNTVDNMCRYLFSVLPQFMQYYPKCFERICQGIIFVKENATVNEVVWRNCFAKNIEDLLAKIIVILCRSPKHKKALLNELLRHIKQETTTNFSLYLLASLLIEDPNRNSLVQFQQYLNFTENNLIRILSDNEWYMTVPQIVDSPEDKSLLNTINNNCIH